MQEDGLVVVRRNPHLLIVSCIVITMDYKYFMPSSAGKQGIKKRTDQGLFPDCPEESPSLAQVVMTKELVELSTPNCLHNDRQNLRKCGEFMVTCKWP